MILARMIEKITVDRHYNIVIRFLSRRRALWEASPKGMRSQKQVNLTTTSGRM